MTTFTKQRRKRCYNQTFSFLFCYFWTTVIIAFVGDNTILVLTEAQQIVVPIAQPKEIWRAEVDAILDGNGVYISPLGDIVVATSDSGNLYAFSTSSGTALWEYRPIRDEGVESIQCFSGVTFSYWFTDTSTHYMVYSVVENPITNPNTRVIAINPDGQLRWRSWTLEGRSAGTPVVSNDGRYVFLTHNSNDLSIGHFTVLDVEAIDSAIVFPIYTEFNRTSPFSPPGIYHQPIQGYYEGGENNTNDIVVWSFAPLTVTGNAGSVIDGFGAIFVFQLPTNGKDLTWRFFNQMIDWTSISPPAITNGGMSLYWAVSDSEFRAWVGEQGSDLYYYNNDYTAAAMFELAVGNPRQASFNTPALSSNARQPTLFAGTASFQFVKMDHFLNVMDIINTTSEVKAQAKITPDDQFVFYTEYDPPFLHMASTANLDDIHTFRLDDYLDGEFAMSLDGNTLYVGDVSGQIVAIQFGQGTPAPVAAQPVAPTTAPDMDRQIPTPAPTTNSSFSRPSMPFNHMCRRNKSGCFWSSVFLFASSSLYYWIL